MKWLYQLFDVGEGNRVYFWSAVWMLFGMALGIAIISVQSLVEKPAAFLWSLGLFLSGGVIGLIFAIPKVVSEANTTHNAVSEKYLQENTNLFQISDWLTKVIVGAGLVQMKEIPPFILKVARQMALGTAASRNNPDGAASFSAAIIVFSSAFGFISGYLITRLVITELLKP